MQLVQNLDTDQVANAAGGCAIGWPDGRGGGSAPALSGGPFGSPAAGGRWRSAPPTPPVSRSGGPNTADRWRPAPGQQPPPPQPPPLQPQQQRRQQPAAEQAVQPLRSDDPWGGQDVPPPGADAGARPALQRGALQAALDSVAAPSQHARPPQHAAPPPPPPAQHRRQQQQQHQHAELARVLGPDVARAAGLLPPQRQQPAHGAVAQQAAQAPKTLHLPSTRPLHKPVTHQQARGGLLTQQQTRPPPQRPDMHPAEQGYHFAVDGLGEQQQKRQWQAPQNFLAMSMSKLSTEMDQGRLPAQTPLQAVQEAALLAEASLRSHEAAMRGSSGSVNGAQAGADLLRLVQRKSSGKASHTDSDSPSAAASPAAAVASSADKQNGGAAAAHTLTGPRAVTRRQLRAQAYGAGTRKANSAPAAAPPLQPGSHPSSSRVAATPPAPVPQQQGNQRSRSLPGGSGSAAHRSGHAPRSSPLPAAPVLKVRRGSGGILEVVARSPTAAAAASAPVAERSGVASRGPPAMARTPGDGRGRSA